MAHDELKRLTYEKLKAAKRLIEAKEWAFAAYVMGYALECALKAAACRTLHLDTYPPIKIDANRAAEGFKSHEIEQLLIISGLRTLFQLDAQSPEIYDNWSTFTALYSGNWTEMRYKSDTSSQFDETTVRRLYSSLYDNNGSIIKTISSKRKW
jgi:hypothetical protein